jgi:signal transduction histidine kinase
MLDVLRGVLASSEYMPHGHCYLWRPGLVWLHAVSDALIGTAYVVISLTLWGLVRRIRLPFSPMILAFGVFIGACGLTHYMEVYTLWEPAYWFSGAIKAITAAASVATGAYLVQARPLILEVTRAAQLAEERRVELESKNRELERLYARVKELDDAKTRFFANVSHELRTPLALVLGPIEKLLSGELPDEARRDLEVARRNGRTLLREVDDLLDVARLEEGRLPLHHERTDLSAIVRDVAAHFSALARERRVALEVHAPAALPAEVDGEKVERVVANLVGNAFKFVRDGGRVRCDVSADGGRARVAVDDDGPGIAPELREVIFERFRQGAGQPEGTAGAGLGLAIARELVELHGGRIAASEAPGGGARIAFELPLTAPAGTEVGAPRERARAPHAPVVVQELRDPAPAPPPRGAAPGADAPSVLVVEDYAEMRRFISDALASEFRVVTAVDGAEALEAAEALRPDVVVTDVMMPRLGGEELTRELRRNAALADTPIVALTARDDEGLRIELLEAGAQDFLVKPFHPRELRARVRNAAAVKRSRDVLHRELATRGGSLETLARELARRKRALEVAADTATVAREQAERASAVKSQFLGMLSHELRTPLTSMQLAIATLRGERGGALSERQRASVDRLQRNSGRLLGLVEALLEYTRVETGRLVVRPEPVDLAALGAEVVDELLPDAQRKLLELTFAGGAGPAPVHTDPRLLRLVLLNLVVNAVKYTERGWVRLELAPAPGGRHRLSVADSGPGIAPADLARIFEPFEQVAPRATAQGVGLGLALVKGIAEALRLELTVESTVGQGTTFHVLVPAETAAV